MKIVFERRQNTGDFSHRLVNIELDSLEDLPAAVAAADAAINGAEAVTTVRREPPVSVLPAAGGAVLGPPTMVTSGGENTSLVEAASPSASRDVFEWTEDNVRTFLTNACARLGSHGAQASVMIGEKVREFCDTTPPRASLIAEAKRAAFVQAINDLR